MISMINNKHWPLSLEKREFLLYFNSTEVLKLQQDRFTIKFFNSFAKIYANVFSPFEEH